MPAECDASLPLIGSKTAVVHFSQTKTRSHNLDDTSRRLRHSSKLFFITGFDVVFSSSLESDGNQRKKGTQNDGIKHFRHIIYRSCPTSRNRTANNVDPARTAP